MICLHIKLESARGLYKQS